MAVVCAGGIFLVRRADGCVDELRGEAGTAGAQFQRAGSSRREMTLFFGLPQQRGHH